MMISLKAVVFAVLAAIFVGSLALIGGIAYLRNTNVLAGWVDEPEELKPVIDEKEAQAKQPLPKVWDQYEHSVPSYAVEFPKVLSSRLRHHQFDDLESFANEIRSRKTMMVGGRWVLSLLYESIEEPAAGSSVDEPGWKAHFALLDDWKAKYPRSITARVAYARSMVNYAWKARTIKYASGVTEAQWKLFYERLEEARKILIDANDEIGEKSPGWYSTMLTIANGEGWERKDYMKTFEEAVELEPTYESYYHQLAVHLYPQWYGKPGEWAAVLAEVTEKQGTEEADAMLELTFDTVIAEDCDCVEIAPEIRKYWPQIKRGFHTREKLYNVTWGDMNHIAHMAYIAGDREEARAMLQQLKNHVNPGFWENDGKLLAKAQAWANEPVQPGHN
jgi:hypothetical protein